MGAYPKFTMSFSIGPSNKERIEAFELYQRAFKAKKLLESTPPDNDDIHIMMEITLHSQMGRNIKMEIACG